MSDRAHVFVSGRVQGVFFRAHTRNEARRLGLNGWVRNLPDGRVEIVAEGDPKQLASLISWARNGPPAARVDDVTVEREEAFGEEEFRILYG